jgi:hypothetical protein
VATIERRVKELEQRRAVPTALHPPGVRTVRFEPFRGRGWPPDGFDLEPLRPAKRRPGPIVFEIEAIRSMSAARAKLATLSKNLRKQVAKSMGYRVIYTR